MPWLSTGIAVLFPLIGSQQSSKHFDLAHCVGRTYEFETNRLEYEQLSRFLSSKVRKEDAVTFRRTGNTFRVWRLKDKLFVFVSVNSFSHPGSATAEVYIFNSKDDLAWNQSFDIGTRTFFGKLFLDPSTYSSQPFVWISTTNDWGRDQDRQVYGFDGNRLALIRFEDSKGRPLEISYERRPPAVGPLPRPYNKDSLLKALGGGDTVQILEALNWLNGRHIAGTGKVSEPREELAAEAKTFHALLDDPDVLKAVTPLQSSPMPWIHAAAKSFASHFRARSRVNQPPHG